jgi:hybrid cluster-associated redox disulfide protein
MENNEGGTAAPQAVYTEFVGTMTVAEAMQLHPRAREVFAGFHLGGCSHCAIGGFETVEQICEGYGVPLDMLLKSLNSLLEKK